MICIVCNHFELYKKIKYICTGKYHWSSIIPNQEGLCCAFCPPVQHLSSRNFVGEKWLILLETPNFQGAFSMILQRVQTLWIIKKIKCIYTGNYNWYCLIDVQGCASCSHFACTFFAAQRSILFGNPIPQRGERWRASWVITLKKNKKSEKGITNLIADLDNDKDWKKKYLQFRLQPQNLDLLLKPGHNLIWRLFLARLWTCAGRTESELSVGGLNQSSAWLPEGWTLLSLKEIFKFLALLL